MNSRPASFACALIIALSSAGSPPLLADDPFATSQKPSADQELSPRHQRIASAYAHYLAARQLQNEGKLREALQHFVAALKADPEESGMAADVASLAMNYEGMEAAVSLLEGYVAAHPESAAPRMHFVQFALTHGNAENKLLPRATALVEEFLQKHPENLGSYAAAVRLYLAGPATSALPDPEFSNRDKAARLLKDALQRPEKDASFWLGMGRLALEVWPLADDNQREAHLAQVNPFYEKALPLAQEQKNEKAELETADFYLFSNQLADAARICEALVQRNGNLDARKRLMRLYEALQRPADAFKSLEELVAANPKDVEHQRLLAGAYFERAVAMAQGRDAEGSLEANRKAIGHLETALQFGGGSIQDYLQISHFLRFADDVEKYDRFTARMAQLFPGNPHVNFQRAQALSAAQKYPEAAELFKDTAQNAAASAPELLSDRFYFAWGVAQERSGRFDEAAQNFDKSIQLTSTDNLGMAANTMNYLGYMWLERNQNLDKAEELILKANELEQNNASFIDSLGWLRFKQGRYAEALSTLLKAESLLESLTPAEAEILEHIAQTYEKTGDATKAKEYWRKTLDLKPSSEETRKRAEKALGLEPSTPKASDPEKN